MRVATVAVLLLLVVPLSAQRYDESVTVNLVEVPVFVERFLKPIPGLTRDDFELFVDGKPQPIEYLDVIEDRASSPAAGRAPAAVASSADLKRRRLVVLLFDIGGSSTQALHRAREEAMQVIQRSRSGDTYAVATVGRTGVRFIVPFTSDRIALQRAIGTLSPSRAGDPFRVATLDTERASWTAPIATADGQVPTGGDAYAASGLENQSDLGDVWNGEPRGGFDGSGSRLAAQDFYRLQAQQEREERYIGDELFVEELLALADRLVTLEGVKHVVLLSERRGAEQLALRYTTTAMRVQERYRAAGVILDAVDIRMPWAPPGDAVSRLATEDALPQPYNSGFLTELALNTGGTITGSLRDLEARHGITYLLAFRPPKGMTEGTHSIRVKVKKAPILTEVRYRSSFTLGSERRGDDALFLADTMLNDIPQGGVTVNLNVEGTSVAATIPGAELLAQPGMGRLPVDVFLYVFGEKGDAVAWSHMKLRVDLAAGREFLEKNPYTIRQKFKLGPGRYAAKALVRIDGLAAGEDRTGFRRTDFVVASN